ncbi:MAG: sulfatase [Acidimicrobiia bacterium]|nr:sulfatase [Acidimicrobiia bacterium]
METRTPTPSRSEDRPNVLFLCFDDLNDWAGFLGGNPQASTPNIDALAADGASFDRAYCTAPMCMPARTSVMWGEQPYQSGIYSHSPASREIYADYRVTMPSIVTDFRRAGYTTIGCGKIFHSIAPDHWDENRKIFGYAGNPNSGGKASLRYEPWWVSPWNGKKLSEGGGGEKWMYDYGPSGLSKDEQPDGQGAAWVRDKLRKRASAPLFLGYGTRMPHIPWRVPQEFFDLHPLEGIAEPEVWPMDLQQLTRKGRRLADHDAAEKIRESGHWRNLIQAYLAAGSYADWCMGTVLDELASSPYADDTAVVLWSDHGYHLGEKLHWRKFTLWEEATRVPLVVREPGDRRRAVTITEPVSTIDVAPTVADICGVELSPQHRGASLIDVIDDPGRAAERPPLMTWQPNNHAVRSGPYRYIRYANGETELYDHRTDPRERQNLAADADMADTVQRLDAFLPTPVSV